MSGCLFGLSRPKGIAREPSYRKGAYLANPLPYLEWCIVDHAKDLVLGLLDSYEAKMERIRALIDIAYRSVRDASTGLSHASQEREEIASRLKQVLAKNCSLRKIDFDCMMSQVVLLLENKKARLEAEQAEVAKALASYLSHEQTTLSCMREKVQAAGEKDLQTVLKGIRGDMEDEEAHVVGIFLDLEQRLRSFNGAQKDLNQRLRDLLDRGDLLKTEDVRNLRLGEESKSDLFETHSPAAPEAAHHRAHAGEDKRLRVGRHRAFQTD